MERGLSRRALFGAGAGLAATAAIGTRGSQAAEERGSIPSAGACSLLPPDRIGLQLYSLSDPIGELGFAKVLEFCAQLGFKQIEFAGYTQGTGPITVQELRKLMDDNGLVAAGTHINASNADEMERVLDDAEVLGIPCVGFSLLMPNGGQDSSGWKATAEQYNGFGEQAAKRGKQFYMHNHFQEWLPLADDPSKRAIDILLAETNPANVFWEMDIFWSYCGRAQSGGGFDPLTDYAIPHRDRIKLFHVKDGRPALTLAGIMDAGQGEIDFQHFFTELFKHSGPDDFKYLWERDNAGDHPRGALASARASFTFIRYGLEFGPGCESDFTAGIRKVSVKRRRTGRRVVRVALQLGATAEVTATVKRGKKTLARTTRTLDAGKQVLTLPLKRGTKAGPAKLDLRIEGGSGGVVTLRDTVRVPARSA